VTYYPSGSPGDNTTNSTSDTSITIGGLSAFTEYSVFVVAVTVAPGPPSTAVNVTTSEAAPTAVRNLMAVAPDLTQISVTWDQPAALNGIVSYIISIVGMDLVTQLTVLNETVSAVNETQYSFETTVEEYAVYVVMVTAVTGGGQGPTVETNFTTPEGVPEAPVNFTVLDVTNISVLLSWLPPGDSNGVLTNYTLVLLDQNNETANMAILSNESLQFEFDNLTPFTDYSVVLFANTSVGAGMETTADFMTDIGIPSQPRNVTALSNALRSLLIEWQVPEITNGPITSYTVNYTPVNSGTRSENFTNATSLVIATLQPFTNYSVAVQACTDAGCGPFSDEIFVLTQQEAPAAPSEVNATNLSSTKISVTWLQPDPTNGVIQHYIVTYYLSGSPGDNTTESTTNTSITIGELSAFTEY